MRGSAWVLVVVGLGMATAASTQVAAEPAAPTVFEASEVDEQLAVSVFRGEAAPRRVPDPVPPVPDWHMGAGEKLWFVDPGAGRVIACRERGTATVGRRVIECSERTLQALRR